MNVLIVIAAFSAYLTLALGTAVAGAVISRRAWKRNDWPEARLAFRAFVAGPVITIVTAITLPVAGLLVGDNSTIDTTRLLSTIAAAAQGAVMLSIAFSLYRLARRSARHTAPPSPRPANEIGRALS